MNLMTILQGTFAKNAITLSAPLILTGCSLDRYGSCESESLLKVRIGDKIVGASSELYPVPLPTSKDFVDMGSGRSSKHRLRYCNKKHAPIPVVEMLKLNNIQYMIKSSRYQDDNIVGGYSLVQFRKGKKIIGSSNSRVIRSPRGNILFCSPPHSNISSNSLIMCESETMHRKSLFLWTIIAVKKGKEAQAERYVDNVNYIFSLSQKKV